MPILLHTENIMDTTIREAAVLFPEGSRQLSFLQEQSQSSFYQKAALK